MKEEIADFIIDFGRPYVLNAIAEAKCYQSARTLCRLFPKQQELKEIYDEETVRRILDLYPAESKERVERARMISKMKKTGCTLSYNDTFVDDDDATSARS